MSIFVSLKKVDHHQVMETNHQIFTCLFLLILFLGCESSTETSNVNGCPFAPADSNFETDGTGGIRCPTCHLEFSHRNQLYSFQFGEMDWVGTGFSHIYKLDQLFAFHITRPSELSQLFKSLNIRTQMLHPDSLNDDFYDKLRFAFQIQNYCSEEFYPSTEGTILDSYNEISKIELIEDSSDEDYTIQEYLISGRFETFIRVNGLNEPIEGKYRLITRLVKKNQVQ